MNANKSLALDVGIGSALTLFVLGSYFGVFAGPLLEAVEFKAYDLRSKLMETLKSPEEIVIVAIDDDAIAQKGRWPWPRSAIADAVDRIAQDKPRVIGLNILFSEPEENQGLNQIRQLEGRYKQLLVKRELVQRGVDFSKEFSDVSSALDSDARLLASVSAAGNVIMPLLFVANPTGAKSPALSPEIARCAIAVPIREESLPMAEKIIAPIESFAAAAGGIGHANLLPESDGVVRRAAPLYQYDKSLIPSFALRVAMSYFGLTPEDLHFTPGAGLQAGKLHVPLDEDGLTSVTFLGPPSAQVIKRIPYQQLLTASIAPDFFKDKIVLLGLTASRTQSNFSTPMAGEVSSVEIMAHAVENFIHQRFVTRPLWARLVEVATIVAVGLFVILGLPRLRAFWGVVLSTMIAVAIASAGTFFFVSGEWVKIGHPLALLLAGFVFAISKKILVTEKGKELAETSAIETNKMLGLSFQGQGMFDLAFDKFRLCPLDQNLKEALYNLALDFERKRQLAKAASVLEHIATEDPNYRDITAKITMLKAAADGAVFGTIGEVKKKSTLLLTDGVTQPTLGRYEIEKELGRGAMGVVYLGRDPNINRMVAIKTLMLEGDSNVGSVKEIKERFFREAESAGTLNHPNIVRIFDAGEENDVAYIAMELLDGQDLTKNTSKDTLLPMGKVVEYISTVADALDYAHKQGIVHRDIKPANIMLIKDGSVRVADFGIARITASSNTATGTVMGTPSYMSPEQVAGRKVDGRSDLFSLTVALFELLTGEKPFKGGDGIGTLLFQIANDPTPDIRVINPAIPAALKGVVERGLQKNPDDRFQRGSEMAAALRTALTSSVVVISAPKADINRTTSPITSPVFEEETMRMAPIMTPPAFASKAGEFPSGDLPELDAILRAAGRELSKYQSMPTPMPKTPTSTGPDQTVRLTPPPTEPQ